MATVIVKCPYCCSTKVIRYGKSRAGRQRYMCKHCMKRFQLEYKNKACKQGIHKLIVDMAMNSSGTRDTARVLGVSQNTVTRVLKKTKDAVTYVNTEYLEKNFVDIDLLGLLEASGFSKEEINGFQDEFTKCSLGMDEIWSYCHDKGHQQWLWWAIDHETGTPIAFCFGSREHKVLDELLRLLASVNIRYIYTDNNFAYSSRIPTSKHCMRAYVSRIAASREEEKG